MAGTGPREKGTCAVVGGPIWIEKEASLHPLCSAFVERGLHPSILTGTPPFLSPLTDFVQDLPKKRGVDHYPVLPSPT